MTEPFTFDNPDRNDIRHVIARAIGKRRTAAISPSDSQHADIVMRDLKDAGLSIIPTDTIPEVRITENQNQPTTCTVTIGGVVRFQGRSLDDADIANGQTVPKAAYDEVCQRLDALEPQAGTLDTDSSEYPALPRTLAQNQGGDADHGALEIEDLNDWGSPTVVAIDFRSASGPTPGVPMKLGWFDPEVIISNLLPFLSSRKVLVSAAQHDGRARQVADQAREIQDLTARIDSLIVERDTARVETREAKDAMERAMKTAVKGEELRVVVGLVKRRGAVVYIDGVSIARIEDSK